MRYLGIDFGKKKTGLAIGDDETKIASPYGVIAGGQEGFGDVKRVVREEGIDAIVIGVPGQENGVRPHAIDDIRLFADRLVERLPLPVHEVDERLTTKEAQRLMADNETKAREDALAAMLILQDYLSEL